MGVAAFASSAAALLSSYGSDEPSKGAVAAGFTIYTVLLIGGWVLSLFIAFWIIRAGVRGGVQQLVEHNRQALAVMQAQAATLNQLAKAQVAAKADASAAADDAAAWDKLRAQ